MTDDLIVRFGGDTSALNASVAAARATLASFAPGVTSQAKASIDGLASSLAAARVQANALSFAGARTSIADVHAATTLLTDSLTDANAAARTMKTTLDGVLFNATVFSPVYAGIAAFTDYAQSVAYAQRGDESFTAANEGAVASIGRTILAVREYLGIAPGLTAAASSWYTSLRFVLNGLDDTQVKAIAAAGGLDAFDAALSRSGTPQFQALTEMTRQLERIPGVTDEAATSIIAMMTTMPDYTLEAQDVLVKFLQTFAKTSDEAVKFTKTMVEAFRDPTNGGAIMGDIAKQIDNVEGQLKLAAVSAQRLAPDQAVVMYDRIEESLKRSRGQIAQQDADKRRVLSTLILENGEEEGAARLIRQQLDLDEQRTRQLDQQLTRLENARQAWAGIVSESAKQAAYVEAIGKASTPTSRINDLTASNEALAGNSRRERADEITPAQRDAAIRVAILEAANQTDEGLLAVLNTMSNRLHATYGDYGTSLNEVISKPKAYTAYDPTKMAAIDPNGRQYQRTAALYDKVFGDDPSDDPTHGATHYYRPDQVNPAWATGMGNRRDIGDHRFGNPDGAPVPSAEQAKINSEQTAQNNTQMREQNALLEGGTAEEKQAAEQARANLAAARDEVAEAAKLIEVRKKAADEAQDGTPQEKAKAAAAVTTAEQQLADRQRAQREAALSLEIAQAQDGSEKKKQLELDLANFKQSRWKEGTAQFEEQEKVKTEISQRYAKQQAADDTSNAQSEYEGQKRSITARQAAIRDMYQAGAIDGREELAQLRALRAEELQLEQSYADKVKNIRGQSPEMVRRYARQEQRAVQQIAAENVKDQEQYLREIEMSYKQHFENVGSTVSGDIMGMLEGSKRFKDMFRDIAQNIVGQFVSAGAKMAADWAAHQAMMLAQSMGFYAADTAAAATSESAKTGFTLAGVAAQGAARVSAIVSSIMASASETFAGIFGFLSPILGPAAIGPAAAGEATVAAAASGLPQLDVGAWHLPNDMVAQLHAGEMVVPAGPAAMMRAAAGGAGAGAAPAGGDTHHYHFAISAVDGNSMSTWLNNGGARQIAKAVGAHQRLNPSTR